MQQTGFVLPSFVFGNGIVTGVDWDGVNNILLVDGDLAVSNGTSDFTIGYVGNLNIPQGSIISGIEIKVIGKRGAQTIPAITLSLSAYDNVAGADIYYPYVSGFTGLTEDLAEYTLGTPSYLFGTSWTVDMINNFKLNLEANGDILLDSVLINVYYISPAVETINYNTLVGTFQVGEEITGTLSGATATIVTDNGSNQMTVTAITGIFIDGEIITGGMSGATALIDADTPGVCIDCSSPIQVQAMYLELPFLIGETKFYLKKGSFTYPTGIPVQPGDIGSCGGTIPWVFDESKRKADGQNFEENAMLDTNNGGTWTVLPSGVIEVDLGSVTQRGLGFKAPAAHDPNNMSNHEANSKVIISNNEPYNLTLVRRCQANTVFSPPITVEDEGVTVTTSLNLINFSSPYVTAALTAPHEVEVTFGFQYPIQFQDDGSDLGAPGDVLTLNFTGAGVTATRVGSVVTVNVNAGGGSAVQSVTGIDTDNTDPLNPIVRISVDGVTITGDGTPGNPLVAIGGGGSGGGGTYFVDQTPNNGTYGVITGAVDGVNTTFVVSQAVYLTGKLIVYLNGLVQLQGAGDDWTETDPTTGTFDFDVAPMTGDIITVVYQVSATAVSGERVQKTFTQTAHGFSVGEVVHSSGTDGEFSLAQGDVPANAEVTGVVSDVIDANTFTIVTEGFVILATGIPGGAVAGDILFLDPATPGALTLTGTTTAGEVNKPLAEIIDDSTDLVYWHNYRGQEQQSTPSGTTMYYFSDETSKNLADASTVQLIPHGLPAAPGKVKLTFFNEAASATAPSGIGFLTYNGSVSSCVGWQFTNGNNENMGASGNIRLYGANNTLYQTGVVTVDATNVIITWTKTSTPTGVFSILCEAETQA